MGTNGTRLPVATLPDDWRKFCIGERNDIDADHTFAKFADHWRGSGKEGRKSDWFGDLAQLGPQRKAAIAACSAAENPTGSSRHLIAMTGALTGALHLHITD